MQEQEIINLIDTAKQYNWKIGLFGWGTWGENYGIQIIEWLGLKLNFISDSDYKKICKLVIKDVEIVQKNELLGENEDILLFVCIGQYYLDEVTEQLGTNDHIKMIVLDDVVNMDKILEQFYGVKNITSYEKYKAKAIHYATNNCKRQYEMGDRIAVYTCITGGYDDILEPLIKEDICDYYLISDIRPDDLKVFSWMDVKTLVPDYIQGFPEMNRYCKMYSESIFPNYRYSIYMDGKIQLVGKISSYIKEVGKIGVGIHKHGFEDCIYTEGMRMVGCGICDYMGVREQMREYLYNGMPRHYGLFECCMIVRDHSNPLGQMIMHQWFDEYMRGQKRDQFSLTYVLWKNGMPASYVGSINNGKAWKDNKSIIRLNKHLK